jgi:hypothetical protein
MNLKMLAASMLVLAALFAAACSAAPAAPARAERVRCTEDMPCWNWATMGDRNRGVVTMWGTPKVVSCGGFRWLVRHGDLDPHTPRLKGDAMCGR